MVYGKIEASVLNIGTLYYIRTQCGLKIFYQMKKCAFEIYIIYMYM